MQQTTPGAPVLAVNRDAQGRSPAPRGNVLSRRAPLLALLAALFLNAALVLVGIPRVARALGPDYNLRLGDLYDLIATNLDQGHGYRVEPDMGETMLREPGYPLFLAAVFKIGGYGAQQARLVCVLLAFGSALMVLRLTRKITGDRRIALLAALLFLVYPGICAAEARAGDEMACIFTVLLFMLALYRAVEERSLRLYGLAGLLLGVAALVRSEVLLFPLFLLAYFVVTSRGWREAAKAVLRMVILGVCTLVAMSPWIVRNYLLVHQFVPTATLSGVAAQEGLYTCEHLPEDEDFYRAQRGAGRARAQVASELGLPFVGHSYYQFFYTPRDEVAFNQALLNDVFDQYRGDPGLLATCAAKNFFFKFWFLGKSRQSTRLNVLVQAPLLLLALGGLVVLWKGGLLRNAAIILLYILYEAAVHAPIIAHARHSMLVVPFLTVLAAVFLVWARHASRIRYEEKQGLGVVG